MRLTTSFKLYKMCILLHRSNLRNFAKTLFTKNGFEKSIIIATNYEIFFGKPPHNFQNRVNSQKIRGWVTPGTGFWSRFHDFSYFMICFLVFPKEKERITGLGVFLPVKRRRLPCVVADDMMYDDVQTMRRWLHRWWCRTIMIITISAVVVNHNHYIHHNHRHQSRLRD